MYGVLGEAATDAETIKVLVIRMAEASTKVLARGFGGKDKLLDKGSNHIRTLRELGCDKFIVCHDADGPDPAINHAKVAERIIKPAGVSDRSCILIPVHTIESWLLADIESASKVFRPWKQEPVPNPEKIPDPKGVFKRLSRAPDQRPRYSHETHNKQIAKHIDITKVARKCPSFRPLVAFMEQA